MIDVSLVKSSLELIPGIKRQKVFCKHCVQFINIGLLHLSQLPKPLNNKVGWPWTEEFLASMPNDFLWPRISVITPSFNQSKYLEETIRSVLLQGYPNLEYIIIDGGSTDGSVDIIRKYEPWLAYWVSEKDRGQSHAINKGWEMSTGEIIAYLCSDDFYFPHILDKVASAFMENIKRGVIVGGIAPVDSDSIMGSIKYPSLPVQTPTDLTLLDPDSWFLPQASAFFSRDILQKVGMWVREDLHYTMDRELFYRVVRNSQVYVLGQGVATYRHHAFSKTTANIISSYRENRKSFAYCNFGGIEEKKLRSKVLKKRISQGYYSYAKTLTGFRALVYFTIAAFYRPKYLLNTTFLKNAVRKSFLWFLW